MDKTKLSMAIVMAAAAAACTGSQGEQGDMGAQGAAGSSVVADTTDEPAGSNCANGGLKFSWGVDDNGNGMLDAGEVDGTKYICNGGNGSNGSNGTSGHNSLLTTTDEPAGQNCAAGGLRVDSGLDDNDNGTLDAGEVDNTDYVCAPGRSLVATAAEPAGQNCATGGTVITSGIDDNNNGTLEAGEIDDTRYVCNGATGLKSLVATASEPAGNNCAAGGTKITYGVDDNNNNTLDANEVDGTAYVCTNIGGTFNSIPNGPTGTTNRGAGDSCGTQINVGATPVFVKLIGVYTTLPTAGNIKFLVFNHTAGETAVYVSPAKPVTANASAMWRYSDALSILLSANTSYDVGAITDVAGTWHYDVTPNTAAGVSSTSTNPNFSNYATPTSGNHAGADCGVQLLTY
jgi:hypothetical protein